MISFEEARAHDPSKKDEAEIDYKKLYESEREARLKAEAIVSKVHQVVRNTDAPFSDRMTILEIFLSNVDAALQGEAIVLNVARTREAIGLGKNAMSIALEATSQAGGWNYKSDQIKGKDGKWSSESTIQFDVETFTRANTLGTQARQQRSDANKASASKREQTLLKTCPDCGADMKIGIVCVCVNCNHAEPDQEYYAKDVTLLINEDDTPPVFIEESAIPPVAPAPYSSNPVVHHIVPSTPPIATFYSAIPEGMEEI